MALPPHTEHEIAPSSPPATSRRRVRWWIVLTSLVALALAGWYGGRHLWGLYHLRAAESALQRYDFDGALSEFECCLRVWPHRVSTQLQAARAARRAEHYDRAEHYLAACEKSGITTETALERAMLRAQQGDLADTELPLQRPIVEGHPDAILFIEALARGYLVMHRHQNALNALEDLIEHDPEHPWAYFWRGKLHETIERPAEALADYRKAVELAPWQSAFRLQLALALLQAGQTARAGPHFEELLRQRPNDPRVLLGAARYERARAQPERALEYLDRLLRDQPENAEGWAQRGRAYRDQGNPTEAVRCLRKAFELQPRSYAIGFDLCTELYGLGQTREAKEIEKKVEHLKNEELAVDRLMARLAREKDTASVRYEIGRIYLRNDVDTQALHWFFCALQDDPNHRPTHEVLAEYYQRHGNAQAAAYHRQRAGEGPQKR
jgi:tetratricopeptide (TPR) repeat protein